ncbi:MAG: DUF2958 domain-containing protein [Gallionella sp.]
MTTSNPHPSPSLNENEIESNAHQTNMPLQSQEKTMTPFIVTNKAEASTAFVKVRPFIGLSQIAVMADGIYGPERQFFFDKLTELVQTIETMPKTYETQDIEDPIVHLHYFMKDMNWHITEKDMEAQQLQAFGKADLGWGFPELGYISIEELLANGAELDLHWTKKPLSQV